jgi:hypothetical protein
VVFQPRNASVAHFDSVYFDIVITVFMLLAGINFSLHYQLLRGRPLAFWKDPECRFYLAMCLILTLWSDSICMDTVYRMPVRPCATPHSRWSPSSPPPGTRRPIMKMAGHVPGHHLFVHVCGRIGRFHRRRDEVPAHHALFQVLLSKNCFP